MARPLKPSQSIPIRIPADLYYKIREIAVKEDKMLVKVIEQLLKEGLKKRSKYG